MNKINGVEYRKYTLNKLIRFFTEHSFEKSCSRHSYKTYRHTKTKDNRCCLLLKMLLTNSICIKLTYSNIK